MANNYELVVKIAGQIEKSLQKSLKLANGELLEMGDTLEATAKQVSQFENVIKKASAAEKYAERYEEAKRTLAALEAQSKVSGGATAGLERKIANAQKVVDTYKLKLDNANQELYESKVAANVASSSIESVNQSYIKASATVDKYIAKIDKLNRHKSYADSMVNSANDMRMGGAIQVVEGLAIASAVKAPINSAMDFESKTKELQKYSDKAAELMQANLKVSQEVAVSYADMADIQASAMQAGVVDSNNIKQIQTYTDTVSKAVLAFDMSGSDVGNKFAQIQSNITGSMEATITMFDHINAVSNATNATAKDLLDVIARSGGVVKGFTKLSDAQLVALSAGFRAVSQDASSAATAQSSFIMALTKGKGVSKTMLEGFEAINVDPEKLAKEMTAGPAEAQQAIKEVLAALKQVKAEERADIFAKIFGGDKGTLDAVAKMVEQYDELIQKPMDIAKQDNTGSMQKEADVQADTVANQEKILMQNLEALKVFLGQEMLPLWNEVLSEVLHIIQTSINWVKSNGDLIRSLLPIIKYFIMIKVGLGAVSYGLGSLVLIGGKAWKTIWLFRESLLVANGVIKGTTVCTKILGYVLKYSWKVTKLLAKGFLGLTKAIIVTTAKVVWMATSWTLLTAKTIAFTVAQKAMQLALLTGTATLKAIRGAMLAFNLVCNTNPILLIVTAIGALIAAGIYLYKHWDEVKAKLIELWASFANKFPLIATIVQSCFTVISTVVSGIYNFITDKVNGLITSFKLIIEFVKNIFTGQWEKAWDNVKSLVVNSFNGMIDPIEKVVTWISEKVGAVIGWIKQGISSVTSFLGFGDSENTLEITQQQVKNYTAVAPATNVAQTVTVPALASGGIVDIPTLALIGEGNEPEAVMPLSKIDDYLSSENVRSYVGTTNSTARDTSLGSIEINFAPVINIQAKENVTTDVQSALKVGAQELKREIEKYFKERSRLSMV